MMQSPEMFKDKNILKNIADLIINKSTKIKNVIEMQKGLLKL